MTIQQMKNTEYLEKTWTLTVTYLTILKHQIINNIKKTWTLTVTYPHENSQAGWDMKFFNFS